MKTVQETLDLFGYHGGDKEPYTLEYRILEYYIRTLCIRLQNIRIYSFDYQ